MRNPRRLLLLLVTALGPGAAAAPAQDLVVTNARVIVGTGTVLPRGSVVVRNGRIASVSQGPAAVQGGRTIDAHGMTVMAGFIDAHRHIIEGNSDRWLKEEAEIRMRE